MTPPKTTPRKGWAGALLVGGRGRRMGRDKLLLPLPEGGFLVDRAAGALRACCTPCFEVGRELGLVGYRSLSDALVGAGPLSGLLAALEACPSDWLLALAGDLPGIHIGLLSGLQQTAEAGAAIPWAVRGPRGIEPLCSAWPRSAAAELRGLFDGGERAVHCAFTELGGCGWSPPSAARLELSLRNLNRPEDWEEWTGSPLPPPRSARA